VDTIFSILTAMVDEAMSPLTAGLAIAVIGLNIHFGLTGLINFGQAGFMLLGAYGFAISVREGVPFPLAILIGLLAAGLFALVLGIPTLQLRGDYLAIVTISAAEIIRYVGRLSGLGDVTGGAQGINGSNYREPFVNLSPFSKDNDRFPLMPVTYRDVADGATWVRVLGVLVFVALVVLAVALIRRARGAGPDASGPAAIDIDKDAALDLEAAALTEGEPGKVGLRLGLGVAGILVLAVAALFFSVPLSFPATGSNGWWVRLVAWSLVGLCTLVAALLIRSPWGRLLRGVREDEDAIRSLGRNVYAIKMQALIIGGLFAGLGGMVYILNQNLQPDAMGRQMTFLVFTAMLLGGLATIFGPVLGAIVFFALRIFIRQGADAYIPNSIMSTQEANSFAFVMVGLMLVLLIIFRPQGILGNKKEVSVNV
jgi:neutral amino acid transport system permease protein